MAIDLFTVGPFTVHGYGLMIGLGFLAALFVGCLLCRKRGLSDNDFVNVALCVLIFGFIMMYRKEKSYEGGKKL